MYLCVRRELVFTSQVILSHFICYFILPLNRLFLISSIITEFFITSISEDSFRVSKHCADNHNSFTLTMKQKLKK